MIAHQLKVWGGYFPFLLAGTKTFEIRKDDRGFQVGDALILREFNPNVGAGEYTGRSVQRRISYILNDFPEGLKPGYVVLGLQPE